MAEHQRAACGNGFSNAYGAGCGRNAIQEELNRTRRGIPRYGEVVLR